MKRLRLLAGGGGTVLLLLLFALQATSQGLKDVFAGDFLMGVSLSGRNVRIDAEQDLIRRHFNSVTCENAMKPALRLYAPLVEHIHVTELDVRASEEMGGQKEEGEAVCVYGDGELPGDFAYRFAVRPCNCFGGKGKPIYTDWTDSSLQEPGLSIKGGRKVVKA